MNYEKELLELVPMLRAYIRKTNNRFGYIDEDDVMQECLIQAFTSARKTDVRNPRNFFIGVFNRTIVGLSRRAGAKRKRMERWAEDTRRMREEESGRDSQKILEEIERVVIAQKPATRRVWAGLKRCGGNQSKAASVTGMSMMTVRTEKKRLNMIYEVASK